MVARSDAEAMVREAERAFAERDVEAILEGYAPDVTIVFADFPPIEGREAARKFLESRFARQQDYTLRKELRILDGDVIGNYWEGEWKDAQTGRTMCGRGTEFWTVNVDGQIARWEATFNVWEKGSPGATPIV